MCERNFYIKKCVLDTKKDLSLEEVKEIVRRVKNKVKFINISAGYGEPLLHKDIIQIIQEIKNNNLKIILFTNATLLTKELSKKIFIAGLDIILFSFEGYSQKEYEDLRIGADYKKVFKNIQYFIGLKKKNKNPIKTILTATITKEDYFRKINSLIEIGKAFSVDKLEIHDTFFCKFIKEQSQRIINIKNKDGVLKDFKILNKKALNYGLEIVLPKIKIKRGLILCSAPFRSLYFRKDGYVRPCCIDYEKIWNKNIFHDDLEKIWNCKEMVNWRNRFIENKPPKMCKKCPVGEMAKSENSKNISGAI